MDIEKLINEKIQRLQDLNREMKSLNDQIGTLQEKGRAYHQQALVIKGGIEALAAAKIEQDEELKKSETAKLILPEGVKPIIGEVAPSAESLAPTAELPKTTPLDVVK